MERMSDRLGAVAKIAFFCPFVSASSLWSSPPQEFGISEKLK
jgi:hypothetical protein